MSRLTHDLRVPFAAVRSALYLLERHGSQISGPREKKWIEAAGSSLTSFEKLLRAVDAHVQTLSYVPPPHPSCDLHEIVKSALALAQDENPECKPILVWHDDVARSQPVDGNLVTAVVRQLLDNAIRHSPVGRAPEIRLHASANGWDLEVTNEGPPIPASEYPRLFTPFFHSQSHLSEQGPGLGLATARVAAEKARCRLTHSRRDSATVFCLQHTSGIGADV